MKIVEEPGRFLEVATTRPETIMADTAYRLFIRRTNDTLDLIGKARVASAGTRENSDRCR